MTIVIEPGSGEKEITEKLKQIPSFKGFDAMKFCGKIKLKESPNTIQKRMRNEWEKAPH